MGPADYIIDPGVTAASFTRRGLLSFMVRPQQQSVFS